MADTLTWNNQKPTLPGAYYVRGFRLGECHSRHALVEVATVASGELVCNINESNINDDLRDWPFVADLADRFEWCGPLVEAQPAAILPKAIAEQVREVFEVHHNPVAEAIDYFEALLLSFMEATPAAPALDLGTPLPCEVKLPGGMTIGKGCTLSTLLLALRNRGDDMPWRQRFGVPVPFDPRLMNLRNDLLAKQAACEGGAQ
ncbi:hypothetical protein [Pseudomonas sp. PS02288]|uniref:hypothetical protein n=1 Tax=Pseudomonas sp. PS02288 TaxID=2991443 RepID=UPI00249B606B|nr:hypothetical protein [Pseudomonas sp. PS02288]